MPTNQCLIFVPLSPSGHWNWPWWECWNKINEIGSLADLASFSTSDSSSVQRGQKTAAACVSSSSQITTPNETVIKSVFFIKALQIRQIKSLENCEAEKYSRADNLLNDDCLQPSSCDTKMYIKWRNCWMNKYIPRGLHWCWLRVNPSKSGCVIAVNVYFFLSFILITSLTHLFLHPSQVV